MAQLIGGSLLNKDKITQNIVLKGNTTNDVTLAWNEPAAARTLTIGDPGGNDSFVFLAATQTLTNKTLDALTNTITNIGASEVEKGVISDQTAETVAADADEVLVYDASATALRRMTRSNFLSGTGGNAFANITDGTTTAIAEIIGDTFKLRSANNILSVVVANDDVTHGDSALFTITEANINHDALTGFVANEHIDHSGVTLTAGGGLTGGGDITAGRTFDIGAGVGITVNANDIAVDQAFTPSWTGAHTFKAGPIVEVTADPADGAAADTVALTFRAKYNPTGATGVTNKDLTVIHNVTNAETGASQLDILLNGNTLTYGDDGSLTVPGDLTVNGTTTTVNSTTLDVADKNITVNNGGTTAGAAGAGLDVEGDSATVVGALRFASGSATKFQVGDGSTMVDVADISTAQTFTNKTIDGNNNTLTVLETQVSDGSLLARLADAETVSGQWDFSGVGAITGNDDINAAKDWTIGRLNTATGVTQGYDSQILKMKASGWDGVSAAEDIVFDVLANAASNSSAQLLIRKKVGSGSLTNILALDISGNLQIAGTIEEQATIATL